MHKKQRHRALDLTPLVHEVHAQRPMRVDLYRAAELRQRRVERGLLRAPVEARLPAREEARDVRERRAVRPPRVVELVRERRQRGQLRAFCTAGAGGTDINLRRTSCRGPSGVIGSSPPY